MERAAEDPHGGACVGEHVDEAAVTVEPYGPSVVTSVCGAVAATSCWSGVDCESPLSPCVEQNCEDTGPLTAYSTCTVAGWSTRRDRGDRARRLGAQPLEALRGELRGADDDRAGVGAAPEPGGVRRDDLHAEALAGPEHGQRHAHRDGALGRAASTATAAVVGVPPEPPCWQNHEMSVS